MSELSFLPEHNHKPTKGKILLAEPFLDDPYFKRTVVYLCEHNEEGSFGFVLNNYVDIKFEDITEGLPAYKTRVSIGGPVKGNNLYFMHTLGAKVPESVEVGPGIYLGGEFSVIKKMIEEGDAKEHDVRFFVGYSGWSPKQLEHEMKQKSWFVAKVKSEILMNTEISDLWKTILGQMGEKGKMIANLPDDPSLN